MSKARDLANLLGGGADGVAEFGGNAAIRVPNGTSAQRPTPANGMVRYNSDSGYVELYSSNAWGSVALPPQITGISPSSFDGESGTSFTILGVNLSQTASVKFVDAVGVEHAAGATTFVSATEIRATTPSDFTVSQSPLSVRVSQNSGTVTYGSAITCGSAPVWTTSSGSLGSVQNGSLVSFTVEATDQDGGSIAGYSLTSGSLPPSCSLNQSSGLISGTPTDVSSNTTYTFTISATDNAGNASTREFSISITNAAPTWVTPGGSLGSALEGSVISVSVSATDPEGGSVTYSLGSGTLPGGISLSSSGVLSGTLSTVSSDTTSTFTITATDTFGNNSSRDFSYTVTNDPNTVLLAYANTQVSSDQTGSFTVGPGVTHLKLFGCAGGGGGGQYQGVDDGSAGGGGGAASISGFSVAVSSGDAITYSVGGGGNGGVNSSGTQGGETWVKVNGTYALRLIGGFGGSPDTSNGGNPVPGGSGGGVSVGSGVNGGSGGNGAARDTAAATVGGSATNGCAGGGGGGAHVGNKYGGSGGNSYVNVGTYTYGTVTISFEGASGGSRSQTTSEGNGQGPAVGLAIPGYGTSQDDNTGSGGGAGGGIIPTVNGTAFAYAHGGGGGGNRAYIVDNTYLYAAGTNRRNGAGGGGFLIIVGANS